MEKNNSININSSDLNIIIINYIQNKFIEASNKGYLKKELLNDLFVDLSLIKNDKPIKSNNHDDDNKKESKESSNLKLQVEEKSNKIKYINYKKYPKKPSVLLPFCNVIVKQWCYGIKTNHGLFTQCTNKKVKGKEYCKTCIKQCTKNKYKLPNAGDIRNRKYNETYISQKKKKEKLYCEIVKKQDIDIKFALKEAKKMEWIIPEKQLKNIKKIKITSIVSDSSDEDNDVIDYKIKEASKEFYNEKKYVKKNIKGNEYLLDLNGEYNDTKNLLMDTDFTPVGTFDSINNKVKPLMF